MKTQWNDAPGGFHPASAPDFLPRRELEKVQLGRLQAVVSRAFERVGLFRKRMDGGMFEDDAQWQFDGEFALDTRHHLRGQERIAS